MKDTMEETLNKMTNEGILRIHLRSGVPMDIRATELCCEEVFKNWNDYLNFCVAPKQEKESSNKKVGMWGIIKDAEKVTAQFLFQDVTAIQFAKICEHQEPVK